MKTYTSLLILAMATGFASCNNAPQPAAETPVTAPATTPSDPDPVKQQKDRTSTKEEDANNTELEINDKGIIVTKKKDGNATDINISKDSGKFRIRTKK